MAGEVRVETARQCYLCRGSHRAGNWLQDVCLCQGVSGWVHQECLQNYVILRELRHPERLVVCPHCALPYHFTPPRGLVVTLIERVTWRVYPLICSQLAPVLFHVAYQTFAVFFGMMTLTQIYGSPRTIDIVLSLPPYKAVGLCAIIPIAPACLNSIPWEDWTLHCLRRCSRVPVIGRVMPREDPSVVMPPRKRRQLSIVIGGLMLPTAAKLTGDWVFRSEHDPLTRTLLGGLSFLLITGVLKMYYLQQLYVRKITLSIENYSPQNIDD